jgi:hypothetical protein
MQPINTNWTNTQDEHEGGISTGIGFTIAWQRGGLNTAGRNGAFLIEVAQACQLQLQYYQNSKYACIENAEALRHLDEAITWLQARRDRRAVEGKLGTQEV